MTNNPVRRLSWDGDSNDLEPLLTREWLVTNGLGGYASGTIAGVLTRRYHGLLTASLQAPFGRTVMLNRLSERIGLQNGESIALDGDELPDGSLHIAGHRYLREFRLEAGLPVWRYEIDGQVLERTVLLPHMQNTVHVAYTLVSGNRPIWLQLWPGLHFRPHDAPVDAHLDEPYTVTARGDHYEVSSNAGLPSLRLLLYGRSSTLRLDAGRSTEILYRAEQRRGYEHIGQVWCPGYFEAELSPEHCITLVASTEKWETILALPPEEARDAEQRRRDRLLAAANSTAQSGPAAELVLAADQFQITPAGRAEDAARARAAGDEVRTVIAGYHWFTDWGRDTMISFEGLTLVTGRHVEAGWILRTFAHYVRDGLIPNLFPEGDSHGLYHTADATLWFFHAIDRYLDITGDRSTLRLILPKLLDIIDHHIRGTRFGIGVDSGDGLLRQGEEGYQLTWMDAKVGDWVVTPRRGKAVEINALWYNALRLLEGWVREERGEEQARTIGEYADLACSSFNERFWYSEGGYLYDVVDGEGGDDSACRPNQVFAVSLRHPVLDRARWKPVLEVVRERLVTPVGLRSLAPGHPDYKPTYDGDLRARDAAYHQGTVWGWLIGPFVDAWLKLYPEDRRSARCFVEGFVPHLDEACVGSMSEIFDAEPPYTPRGCIAQAWTVAEVLRSWAATADQDCSG
jgi:predicted glycogen debranching enzyme